MSRAPVLVHGATGFTGTLVCEALRRRGVPFAIAGRSLERLDALASALGGPAERCLIDIQDPTSIDRAVQGRTIVCACAGPFVEVGEPILAACARVGVHYADTTGEPSFVQQALDRHDAVARKSGACVVPAMAYEIAPADWAASVLAERVGGAPDSITILYAVSDGDGKLFDTSRGSKRSALGILVRDDGGQWIDGAFEPERLGRVVRSFEWVPGESVVGVSFPSPNAHVTPSHTGARNVCTFLEVPSHLARVLHASHRVAPGLARLARPLLDRLIARSPLVPEPASRRAAPYRVVCEATKAERRATLSIEGCDPYGLSGELIAYAADRAVAGAITARGVVAPSVAFPAAAAFDALRSIGVRVQ
jgi:short subunit dehydrogenase-like uncharacterized protein